MLSQIGLNHLFCSPYLPQGSYMISILSSLSNQGHTNKQLYSLADSHVTHWFELLYKIPLILYCEHLQHFAKEICGSYFISLPTSSPRLIKKNSLTVFINRNNTVPSSLVRTLNDGSFFSC